MAQRRFHYEQAFEHYLRANRYPYIAVDEAKKSLIPPDHKTRTDGTLKNFDFVVYGPNHNQLIDVKGRKCRLPTITAPNSSTPRVQKIGRLESWVTQDDLDSLTTNSILVYSQDPSTDLARALAAAARHDGGRKPAARRSLADLSACRQAS